MLLASAPQWVPGQRYHLFHRCTCPSTDSINHLAHPDNSSRRHRHSCRSGQNISRSFVLLCLVLDLCFHCTLDWHQLVQPWGRREHRIVLRHQCLWLLMQQPSVLFLQVPWLAWQHVLDHDSLRYCHLHRSWFDNCRIVLAVGYMPIAQVMP